MNGIRQGRSMALAIAFLADCRRGVRAVIFGPGYVVLPRKIYDEMVDKQVKYTVHVDEANGFD